MARVKEYPHPHCWIVSMTRGEAIALAEELEHEITTTTKRDDEIEVTVYAPAT